MHEAQAGPIQYIPGENRGKYPNSHSIYVQDAGILVDAGGDRNHLAELKANGKINAVWLSHWHEDHITHLDLFENVPVYISQTDAPPLMDIETMLDYYGVEIEFRGYWKDFMKRQLKIRPRIPDGYLVPGQILDLGPTSVEILDTPGHTAGHLAFYFKEAGVLYMGDYDLGKFGPWYGDRNASIEQTIASVAHLRSIPAGRWITSHETGFFEQNPGGLWDAYLGVIQTREEKLLDFLQKPRTLQEIVHADIVYLKPREPKAFFQYGERAHMEKHLLRLQEKGDIGYKDGRYYIK